VTGSKACERRVREAFKRAEKGKKTLAAWDCKNKWFWDGYKGGRCWSCNGWRRTAHHVNSGKACVRNISAKMYRAKRHGSVNNPKPKGAFSDPRKGGEYWSCPAGYKRTVVPVTSGKACVKVIAPTVRKAKATYRGKMGCAKGAFKNGLYPECYRCPKGYGRSLEIGRDLSKLRKACVKVVVKLPKPNAKFLKWAKKEAKKINQKYLPVMKQIAAMAPRIASKKNIDAYMNAKSEAERKRIRYHMIKPFLAWVKKRSRRKASLDFNWAQHDYPGVLDDGTVGVKVASADAAQTIQLAAGGDKVRKSPSRIDAFPTVSLGMAIDVSIGFGGTFGALEASDTTASGNGRNRGITYTSAAWTVGASAGGDVAPEIGIWTPLNHGLGGDAHGFVVAAAFKGGLGITYWWDYKGKYLGFALVPQVGLSAEAEYIRGNTKIGDKQDLYSKDEN